MLKKRTRRILVLIVLMTSASILDPLIKLLIVGPLISLLLIEWDEFYTNEVYKNIIRR